MIFGAPKEFTQESLDELSKAHAERARRADAAGDRIMSIVAVGRSAKGLVEVTVDGSAVVTDIYFAPSAPSSYAVLGHMVKQAHDRAVAEWNRQVREITENDLADDEQLRAHIQSQSDTDMAAHIDPANLDEDDDERPVHRVGL